MEKSPMKRFAIIAPLAAVASAALAQPAPDYGLQWRTIGAPGNPDARVEDYQYLPLAGTGPIGGVNYQYRMTRTEITYTNWVEFVDAYSQVNPSVVNDPAFYGLEVYRTGNQPGNYGWYTPSYAANAPAEVGWLYAARYCNWLTNGKSGAPSAFESGAYDMSTFQRLPDGSWVGQTTHSPGALFWIPTIDEWTKGMHWDPNKFGAGQGGYWLYPHSKDVPPIPGPPGTPGAETGAGPYPSGFRIYPVGSYPDAQSPWGLLDGSGGASEWLEGWTAPGLQGVSGLARGSQTRYDTLNFAIWDRLDWFGGPFPDARGPGAEI